MMFMVTNHPQAVPARDKRQFRVASSRFKALSNTINDATTTATTTTTTTTATTATTGERNVQKKHRSKL